jgi:hypothetical protein
MTRVAVRHTLSGMYPVVSFAERGVCHAPHFASSLRHAVGRWFARSLGAALVYVVERQRAKAAEVLYTQFSRLSDAELARRGLNRTHLAQFIRDRLY